MDIISQFSDDLLIRILSLVPTSHALATSRLSKRWQFLWSLVPKLEYDDSSHGDDNYATFTHFVYRSLMSNKAPVLESLYLKLGHKCQAVDIGIWIDTAVAHRVRALTVDILSSEKGPISLPSSMYTCETLETLILWNCIRLDVPFSVRLPSLKIMELKDVDIGSLQRLLSGCPKLETLAVKQDNLDVALALPSLLRLKMTNEGIAPKGSGFVIDAPSLVRLCIKDDVLYDFHRIEYMPQLEQAYVDMTCGANHKFLKAFTCVRTLHLCLSFSEVLSPCGMIFHNLVLLELSTCAQGWWNLLTHMLQNSPKLKYLILTDEHELDFPSIETPDCWKPPISVPNCFSYSLEDFEWDGYNGRRGDREIATYLVAHATRLKTAVFSPADSTRDDVGERYRMLQDLASVATPQIFFE
ncbi:unnamed protein product [Thlaspi arvense]|uniref:FBD domain-containing protein n=1 Tax=Thlaspi arvense TaxID=13288 RepID=A0AAU9SDE8_THLAR|nr:unnamed protein product [Thlaspi arvense]